MNLSSNTLNVLKNFAGINVNLVINEGNVIRTLGPSRNIFAKAVVDDSFPVKFAIYDLNSLIQALTLFSDSEVEFEKDCLLIKSNGSTIKYFYSAPSIVAEAPSKEIVPTEVLFEFELAADDVAALMKVAAALASPTLSITAKGGKANLILSDRKIDTSNSFNKEVGKTKSEFDAILRVETLKLLPGDYEVSIAKKGTTGMLIFKNKGMDLTYWMTIETDSKV